MPMQQAAQAVCPQEGGFSIKTGRVSARIKRTNNMLFSLHNLPIQVDRNSKTKHAAFRLKLTSFTFQGGSRIRSPEDLPYF
jgi:hypothetical protein